MAKTSLICGCDGEIGCDLRIVESRTRHKYHIKFYCRKNCGLNFNYTRTFQRPTDDDYRKKTEKIVWCEAVKALKKAIRYPKEGNE